MAISLFTWDNLLLSAIFAIIIQRKSIKDLGNASITSLSTIKITGITLIATLTMVHVLSTQVSMHMI